MEAELSTTPTIDDILSLIALYTDLDSYKVIINNNYINSLTNWLLMG